MPLLKKIRILPDQYVFKENEKGDTAFLVISGGLIAELDSKKIGKIETGEIFGELSLILGEEFLGLGPKSQILSA